MKPKARRLTHPARQPVSQPEQLPREPIGLREVEAPVANAGVLRLEALLKIVLDYYNVFEDDFRGRGRHKDTVRARQAFVWLARQHLAYSYPELAYFASRPNHSSLITQMRRCERRMIEEVEFRNEILELNACVVASKPGWKPSAPAVIARPTSGPYRVQGEFEAIPLEGGDA